MSASKYRRFSPQSGQSIHESSRVWNRRGDILPTSFADDEKGMDAGRRASEHENSIGEYKANISAVSLKSGRLHAFQCKIFPLRLT